MDDTLRLFLTAPLDPRKLDHQLALRFAALRIKLFNEIDRTVRIELAKSR